MIREILQKRLDSIRNTQNGLSEVLRWLYKQQLDIGFIQDDLTQVKYFCRDNSDHTHFFSGQFNPRRAERKTGSGRQFTPRGITTNKLSDTSCFLCVDNVRWQQRGIQMYYQYEISARKYNVLCNPFPFMPVHMTIASDDHISQTWHVFDPDGKLNKKKTEDKVRQISEDLYEFSEQLKDFVGFYNGRGSGATIERHLHYHFFMTPDGHPRFPLQIAAIHAQPNEVVDNGVRHLKIDQAYYPLVVFRLVGEKRKVISTVVNLAIRWDELVGDSASANIVSIWEDNRQVIYFIPRNKFFSRAPGMAGMVGGCEALGDFIFSTDWEDEAINRQKIDYEYMWHILQSIRPPFSDILSVRVPD